MSATGGLYASMGASAASSILTGYSQARAYRAAGAYQQALAETNATMAETAAEQTIQAGGVAASRKNLETKARVGEELAQQGASGVSVGSGSAAMVRNATSLAGDIDELTIRNNASRAANGYKVQAIEDRYRGRFAQLTARSEANQSLINAGLGAISGPLAIQSNYLRYARMNTGGSNKIPVSYVDTGTSV